MKRWAWRLGGGLLGVIVVAAVAGATYEQVARWRAARLFPPTGRIIQVNGRGSHIDCRGQGSPIVLLEAGFDAGGSYAWDPVHDELASLTRTCAYDRAGILWSERRDEPRDAYRIADELHALLAAAGERPPYVMVGHSLGGPLVRVYDARYRGEVTGFVFVDSSHPEQIARLPARRQSQPPEPGLTAWLFRSLGIMRLTRGPATDVRSAHAIRTLPGLAAERNGIRSIFEQAAETGSLQARPVIVLTAGRRPDNPAWSEEVNARMRETWSELQAELAQLSTNSLHRTIQDASHYIQLDAPDEVVAAVGAVLVAARTGATLERSGR